MNTQTQTLTRKILIVDDDPRLRDLLRRYLSEQGFNVYVAEDAKEMAKLWQREHFDLLVLDLMLPGEDGLSICRRLRGSHDNTPIIMLTAKAEEIDPGLIQQVPGHGQDAFGMRAAALVQGRAQLRPPVRPRQQRDAAQSA